MHSVHDVLPATLRGPSVSIRKLKLQVKGAFSFMHKHIVVNTYYIS